VRLRFKDPLGPHDFRVLLKAVSGCRAAMLGNTHSEDHWTPSHKATLFFDEPTSEEAMAAFTTTLVEITSICHGRLADEPAHVVMTQAARKLECHVCGDRDKAHKCLSTSVMHARSSAAHQRHGNVAKPAATAAAVSPSASAAAASAAKGSAAPKAAAKPKSFVEGICPQWMRVKHCSRGTGCKMKHPSDWSLIPDDVCRQFAQQGSCQWQPNCSKQHLTLEQLKEQQPATAAAASRTLLVQVSGAQAPPAAKARPAAASASRAESSAAAAAAAPATPSKQRAPSSLAMLASPTSAGPTRTQSTPSTSASRPSSVKKNLLASAGAVEAAAVDQDGFQQQKSKPNKRRRGEQQSSRPSAEPLVVLLIGQPPRKAARASATQQKAAPISVSSDDEMEKE